MPRLDHCLNVADFRQLARRKLPAPMFHYIDGGADDEWTLARNTSAFEDWEFLPGHLNDISQIDLRTKVLGTELAVPFFLAPTGMTRLFHHDKELAVARAAHAAGTLYSLSTLSTTSLEEVAAETTGPKMFQIYILKDRELTREFVQRCKASGYGALCLTVDTLVAGNRERDSRHGMTMPPRIGPANALSYATSFSWLYHFLRSPDFRLANVVHRVDALGGGAMGLIDYVNSQFDRTVTWDDVAWLAEQWDGPFAIKGLQSPADVVRAREVGASAVLLSNHGGRQLDGAAAPFDCVAEARAAVGDALELIVDGGVRRGTHVLKALARGADAVSFGRPYLYALAAGGERGVRRMLSLLTQEIERDAALLGVASLRDLQSSHIRPVASTGSSKPF